MLLSEVMELISMGLCPHSVENGISKMLSVFPHNSFGKESACNAGDPGSIPGLGRSPGGGNGNPFQYSCLENPMDRGTWRAIVHGVTRNGHDLGTKPPPPPPSP